MNQERIERAREALGSDVDERRIQGLWRRVEAGRGARSRRSAHTTPRARFVFAGVAAGTLLVLVGALSSLREDSGGPLRLADGSAVPATFSSARAESTPFDDGSFLDLAPGSRVDVLETTPDHVRLALRAGRATFRIRPHGPRRWEVACGPLTVEVVGTVFTVARDEAQVHVDVARGAVLVRGEHVPDQVQRLGAGQSLTVASTPAASSPRLQGAIPTAVTERGDETETDVEGEGEGEVEGEGTLATESVAHGVRGPREGRRRPVWREHLDEGRYDEAYDALGAEGLQREATQTSDVAELMRLADLARLTGHPRDAIGPLERVMARGGGDRSAAIAAYTLGRLRLEQLGDPGGAVQYFERSLDMGLPAALREPARARLVRALHADGDPRTLDAGRRYLELHPEGASADAIRGWVE